MTPKEIESGNICVVKDGMEIREYTAAEDVSLLVWFRSKLLEHYNAVIVVSNGIARDIEMIEMKIESAGLRVPVILR